MSAVGPDAPGAAGPPPGATLPKPTLAGQGKAVLKGKKLKVNVAGEILLPNGISGAAGCTGTVKVTLLRGKKRIAGKTTGVSNACKFRITAIKRSQRSKVKQVKRLKVRLAFRRNAALAPSSTKGSIPGPELTCTTLADRSAPAAPFHATRNRWTARAGYRYASLRTRR